MQAIYRMHGHANSVRAQVSFAAPMVGASPDNIGAKRLAEGGVPTSGAGSATHQAEKNWSLTPIKARGF